MTRPLRIPPALELEWRREPAWLDQLPQLVEECAERWQLTLEEPFPTPHSLVIPAGDLVLKLNAPSHREADHEADALEWWDGNGAVRLLSRDDSRRALLIERCWPGTHLADSPADLQHRVATDLVVKLTVELGDDHPFRFIADDAAAWAEEMPTRYEYGGRPFDPALLAFAIDVFRSTSRTARFLVNQDLHEGNILSAQRRPWLVIDPKPAVGERVVSAVGLLRNAAWRGGVPAVRRCLAALEAVGFDRDRALGWGVAHALAWGWDPEARWSIRSIRAASTIFDAR